MQLRDIYIYPIKSMGGIRLSQCQVNISGFPLDRRWMLVDVNGQFLSQRVLPKMALLQVNLSSQGLLITHKQEPELIHRIPFEPKTGDFISVKVWEDIVRAEAVSPASHEWFSRILGITCQLVYMPESSIRPIEKKYAINQETVRFADAMPYLLIGQKSLDDLNQKLPKPVPMNRFRPNLVFSGGEAFEEDKWDRIKIGDCLFKITKPCARCIVTTVEQESGLKGKEPLKTLAKYRTIENKVLFGQNMIALNQGIVKMGDIVQQVW